LDEDSSSSESEDEEAEVHFICFCHEESFYWDWFELMKMDC
jgi:hypothetical protein